MERERGTALAVQPSRFAVTRVNNMVDREKRNYLENWCAEGESLMSASNTAGARAFQDLEEAFAEARPEECRAAMYLLAFTGKRPEPRDVNGLQNVVDILLHDSRGVTDVVEVTSSRDEQHDVDFNRVEKLARKISDEYRGSQAWRLSFGYGWTSPATGKETNRLALDVARRLEEADAEAVDRIDLDERLRMVAHKFDGEGGSVIANGWATNSKDDDRPYLLRLSEYLNTSEHIQRNKLPKLAREANEFRAQRVHLYLLVASTGTNGGLLPSSPSMMTHGTFQPPRGLTDVWLYGGTGELYHWSQDEGWVFHRIR